MFKVEKIVNPSEKQEVVKKVLSELPEWFGIDEATQWYINDSKTSECLVVMFEEEIIGFVTLSNSSSDCAEVVCMGVLPAYHGKGAGRELMKVAETLLVSQYSLLQVKTVDEGYYKEYDATNHFYHSCGFKKLEVFPTLWDEHNPCLIWVKAL